MAYKTIITAALIILVMIFVAQNAAVVEVRLLFWKLALPRSVLIFTLLVIGFVIGWFSRSMFRVARNKE